MPAGVTGCPANMDCSNYFCISSAMSKNWKKAGKQRVLQCLLSREVVIAAGTHACLRE